MKNPQITSTQIPSQIEEKNLRKSAESADKKPSRRIKMLVRRALREKARGNAHYDRAAEALLIARNCGLTINQPIEIETPGADGAMVKEQYELHDNFSGEAAYRNARIPHFELKKIPKAKRGVSAAAYAIEKEIAAT